MKYICHLDSAVSYWWRLDRKFRVPGFHSSIFSFSITLSPHFGQFFNIAQIIFKKSLISISKLSKNMHLLRFWTIPSCVMCFLHRLWHKTDVLSVINLDTTLTNDKTWINSNDDIWINNAAVGYYVTLDMKRWESYSISPEHSCQIQ